MSTHNIDYESTASYHAKSNITDFEKNLLFRVWISLLSLSPTHCGKVAIRSHHARGIKTGVWHGGCQTQQYCRLFFDHSFLFDCFYRTLLVALLFVHNWGDGTGRTRIHCSWSNWRTGFTGWLNGVDSWMLVCGGEPLLRWKERVDVDMIL
jgi:hypothetical protein